MNHNTKYSALFATQAVTLLLSGTVYAQSPGLDAPVVHQLIKVRLVGKDLTWAADKQTTGKTFDQNAVFLTKGAIAVAYSNYDPLTTSAAASSTVADDPSFTAYSKLLGAFSGLLTAGIPGLKTPTAGGAGAPSLTLPASSSCTDPDGDVSKLLELQVKYKSQIAALKKQVGDWPKTIDDNFANGLSGPAAIRPVIDQLSTVGTLLQNAIDAARPFLDSLNSCESNLTTLDQRVSDDKAASDKAAQAAAEALTKLNSGRATLSPEQYNSALDDYTQKAVAANDAKAKLDADRVKADAARKYNILRLDDLSAILKTMSDAQAAAKSLAQSLSDGFNDDGKWAGESHADYILLRGVKPTLAKMQSIQVTVQTVTLSVSDSGVISTANKDAGSAKFDVRAYSILVPEIGVGLVLSWIHQPTYGTGTNADGKTVVAKKGNQPLSTSGAVIADFVCRCSTGVLSPMIQIGANASKDVPGILVGGGFRLFGLGKGDFAIGAGMMAGWYKDLQKLKVGDVITGTSDINSDLALIGRPKFGPYFTFLYQF